MAVAVTVPVEKFRLANTRRGTSGSRRLNRCQRTNATSSSTPAPMISGMLIAPATVPQP